MPYPTTDYTPNKVTYNVTINAHGANTTVVVTAPGYSSDEDWPDRIDDAVRALRDSLLVGDENGSAQIWRNIDANTENQVTG